MAKTITLCERCNEPVKGEGLAVQAIRMGGSLRFVTHISEAGARVPEHLALLCGLACLMDAFNIEAAALMERASFAKLRTAEEREEGEAA